MLGRDGFCGFVAPGRAVIRLTGASWEYPDGTRVGPVDLQVRPGELVLLTGPTGCGKSTVLRLAAGLLQRHGRGRVAGSVRVGGRDPALLVAGERVRALGFVGQDPDDAVVTMSCTAEVAFGLESAGASPGEIDAEVERLLARVGLAGLGARAPSALSGGQRQRLVIAAALAAGARALLLDEPLSQLDATGAREVLALLRELAEDGVAVLCVEHRLEATMPVATRTVLMDLGRIVSDPLSTTEPLRARGLQGPALHELADRKGLSVGSEWRVVAGRSQAKEVHLPVAAGEVVLRVEGLTFGWSRGPAVVEDVSLVARAGERIAIVGPNGAGKSSLIGLLAGRLRPRAGLVVTHRCIEVPQNPDLALFCETVLEELRYGPAEQRRADAQERALAAAAALSIDELLARAPQALSRGQRLRTAVAAALACAPTVLLLDEPTSGQDRDQVDRMLSAIAVRGEGCLLFASHDLDVVLRHSTRVIVLGAGRIVAEGPPFATLLRSGLTLPPLAALCAALNLPYAPPEQLVDWLEAVT